MSHVGTADHHWEGDIMSTQAARVTVVQTESGRLAQYLTVLPEEA